MSRLAELAGSLGGLSQPRRRRHSNPVSRGHRGETEVEVIAGLDAGATVAVQPGAGVKEGARVAGH